MYMFTGNWSISVCLIYWGYIRLKSKSLVSVSEYWKYWQMYVLLFSSCLLKWSITKYQINSRCVVNSTGTNILLIVNLRPHLQHFSTNKSNKQRKCPKGTKLDPFAINRILFVWPVFCLFAVAFLLQVGALQKKCFFLLVWNYIHSGLWRY